MVDISSLKKSRRILVIGSPGSGKSTLAIALGQRLNLPVHHLDALFWNPGWKTTPTPEWRELQRQLVLEPEWIIDGNYGGTFDIRMPHSESIVLLDFPLRSSMSGVFKRFLRYRGNVRPDMAPDCPEQLDYEFLRWIWRFRRDERPRILQAIESYAGSAPVFTLSSHREVRSLLDASSRK